MTTPRPDDTTCTCCCKPRVQHVHGRDGKPCPATRPTPLRPTKPISRWLFQWAEAVLHEDTFRAFVQANPADFPELAVAA